MKLNKWLVISLLLAPILSNAGEANVLLNSNFPITSNTTIDLKGVRVYCMTGTNASLQQPINTGELHLVADESKQHSCNGVERLITYDVIVKQGGREIAHGGLQCHHYRYWRKCFTWGLDKIKVLSAVADARSSHGTLLVNFYNQ